MLRFQKYMMKMENNSGYNQGDGGGEPPVADEKPPEGGAEEPKNQEFDDYGYPKKQTEEPPKQEEPGKEKPPEEEPPKKEEEKPPKDPDPNSGYGKPPEEPEEKDDGKKEGSEEKPDSEGKDGLKISDKGELLDEDVEEILSMGKELKLTQEQVDGLANKRKAMIEKFKQADESAKAEQENKRKQIHKQWYEDLKSDKDFGGDKFDTNVKKVDRFIDEFWPDLKKQLTNNPRLLPPYFMRDLLRNANRTYTTEKLVEGEALKQREREEQQKKDSGKEHLDFYNNSQP